MDQDQDSTVSRLRALSLYRPFAPTVAAGLKYVECREWWSGHLGDLAIHAAKKLADDDHPIWEHAAVKHGETGIGPGGVVVAVVSLVACLPMRCRLVNEMPHDDEISLLPAGGIGIHRRGQFTSINDQLPFGTWKHGAYGFLLDAVRPLAESVPVRGMPGMWTLSDWETDAIRAQL